MNNSDIKSNTGYYSNPVLNMSIKIIVALLFISFVVLGFLFLKNNTGSGIVSAAIAIIWGIVTPVGLFFLARFFTLGLSLKARERIIPYIFVAPAVIIMGWYLFLPMVRTFYLSFFDRFGNQFAGLENYIYMFTDRTMKIAFVNNLLWLVFGTGMVVVLGLAIAIIADRFSSEKIYKTLIFLPMSISFVGTGVIWKFVYAYQPEGSPQYGLLNALYTAMGNSPQNWIVNRPWNSFFLIFILIWLYTGFSMVIFSSAIKALPKELREAASIDGASELLTVFKIIIPSIVPTIVSVTTTVLLVTLKVFDIVYTMTNGLYGTEVLASQQYKQMFKFLHYGRGSAIAVVIFLAVIPVMIYNLRQFSRRRVLR